MALMELAPAKLNLALHVLGRREDGYHALESLVAFANFGDQLALDLAAPRGLVIEGPFAFGLETGKDNLVLKAETAFLAAFPAARSGGFTLLKHLPVASGIGGGSADAAAALRLLARANNIARDHPGLFEIARVLGADVPVCLAGTARIMRGIGHDLAPPIQLPPLGLVLVNPNRVVETRAVFSALALKPGEVTQSQALLDNWDHLDRDTLIEQLARCQNDLQQPARMLCPVIDDVLEALSLTPDCLLARMSGSGATCFALYTDAIGARRAADAMIEHKQNWWIRAGQIA